MLSLVLLCPWGRQRCPQITPHSMCFAWVISPTPMASTIVCQLCTQTDLFPLLIKPPFLDVWCISQTTRSSPRRSSSGSNQQAVSRDLPAENHAVSFQRLPFVLVPWLFLCLFLQSFFFLLPLLIFFSRIF